jgi:anti-sigma B factor antagonist
MKINADIREGMVILSLKGNLMGAPETEEFRDAVKKHLEVGAQRFIIDLADVKWMNSLGLGSLISTYTSVKNKDGVMVIANVSEKIKSLFMITQLIKVFQNFNTIDEAIEAIKNTQP